MNLEETILSECEEKIMHIIWSSEEDLDLLTVTARSKDLYDKEWKLQTVATFMTRLKLKGYIDIYRIGRYSHYHAIVSREQYRNAHVKFIFEVLFNDLKEYEDKKALVKLMLQKGIDCERYERIVDEINGENEPSGKK